MKIVSRTIWLFLWLSIQGTSLFAQANFYKFPVTEEGVYRITQEKARQLGAGGVENLRILGYPGMLPQKLEIDAFELNEIPVRKIGEDLYFFLSSSCSYRYTEGKWNYGGHYYSDTLFYLIEINSPFQKEVTTGTVWNGENAPGQLFQVRKHKKEEYNILSSGRNWYGDRMFSGEGTVLEFDMSQEMNGPVYFHANLMAQSLSTGNFNISINAEPLEMMEIQPIPNATYGIKGREVPIQGFTKNVFRGNSLQVNLDFQSPADRNGAGYLDYFLVGLPISNLDLVPGIYYNLLTASIELPQDYEFWDITHFPKVKTIHAGLGGDTKKIAVFDPANIREIPNTAPVSFHLRMQPEYSDFIIITHPLLLQEAGRLAQFKNRIGIATQVVTTHEIYDNFGYGNRDITAIRNFIAFQFHSGQKLENVLFFGKGTFDYKNIFGGRPNLVPTYSSRSSLNPLTTYSSDDFFGFLQMGEGEWAESREGDLSLSIGLGRIPVINKQEAQAVVQKIISYSDRGQSDGNWKRRLLFVADDGDNNIHLNDSESHASYIRDNHPEMMMEKLYLDYFEQANTGSSQVSPLAKAAFQEKLEENLLLINYVGHGNETTLTAEQLFTVADLENWPESTRLPLFVTATCEFGRHDSPLIRSGAEELLLAPRKGAIALLTTGRPVFSSINFSLNKAFFESVFTLKDGESQSLGQIFQSTKNNSLNGSLNRNFSLLGDPSLKLNLPEYLAVADNLYDMELNIRVDTLMAYQRIQYQGEILDPLTLSLINSFNGEFEVSLNDKPLSIRTLGDESEPAVFLEDNNFIHKGIGQVENGKFEGEILISKNIDYSFGQGIIKIFAKDRNAQREAFGAKSFIIGGTSNNSITDNRGPDIRLFIGDSISGSASLASTSTRFLALLEDESGINQSGLNLGQHISLTINENEAINLNSFFRAVDGGYEKGWVDYPLTGLREGLNFLQLSAWDNVGNFSSREMEVWVEGSTRLQILDQLVYPNPAIERSIFRITHNRQGENLFLNIRVFSVMGSEIFSLSRRFPKAKPILDDIVLFFLESKMKNPVKGTYIYTIELYSEVDGTFDQRGGKIIIK